MTFECKALRLSPCKGTVASRNQCERPLVGLAGIPSFGVLRKRKSTGLGLATPEGVELGLLGLNHLI